MSYDEMNDNVMNVSAIHVFHDSHVRENYMSPKHVTGQRSIGNYTIEKTIGSGTFGKVKLGLHKGTGMRVAVKVLEKQKIVDAGDVERVSREIHILKLIRHPHIVRLYEIVESTKQLYLIMEYAPGGELFDFIVRRRRLEEVDACRLFRQLVAGLAHMHANGIAHRDLKPENLLLDGDSQIKIVDFGLSNTFTPGQSLRTACGSPCYASPEMISGKSYDPRKSDIWSIGIILYVMVCGCLPFEHSNTTVLYEKILSGEFTMPAFLSREVKALIRGILMTDPNKRWSLGDIQNNEWFSMLPDAMGIPDSSGCGMSACKSCADAENDSEIDQEVLGELAYFEIPLDYVIKCLKLNKHNHATTTYHLLKERKRQGLAKLNLPPQQSVKKCPIFSLATPLVLKPPSMNSARDETGAPPLPFSSARARLAPSTVAALVTARRIPGPVSLSARTRNETTIQFPSFRNRSRLDLGLIAPASARPDIMRPPSESRTRSVSPAVGNTSRSGAQSARPLSERNSPLLFPQLVPSTFARPTASSAARTKAPVAKAPFGSTAKRLNIVTPSPAVASSRPGSTAKPVTPFTVNRPFAIPISTFRMPVPRTTATPNVLSGRRLVTERAGDKTTDRKVHTGQRLITSR
jgi:serine/threonine protein kinase